MGTSDLLLTSSSISALCHHRGDRRVGLRGFGLSVVRFGLIWLCSGFLGERRAPRLEDEGLVRSLVLEPDMGPRRACPVPRSACTASRSGQDPEVRMASPQVGGARPGTAGLGRQPSVLCRAGAAQEAWGCVDLKDRQDRRRPAAVVPGALRAGEAAPCLVRTGLRTGPGSRWGTRAEDRWPLCQGRDGGC